MVTDTKPPKLQSATQRSRGRPAGRTTAQGVIANRERLLEAAEKLIRAHGPDVSLTAIAQAAGVSKPIVYREVGDRDMLVNALAERLASRMAGALTQLVAQASVPEDGLRQLVGGFLKFAAEDRDLYLFVTAGGVGADRLQQSLLLADGSAAQFAEPIATYRAAHGANPDVAKVWSYGLVGALHYVTLWWLRDASAEFELVVEQITSLLWSGMRLDRQ